MKLFDRLRGLVRLEISGAFPAGVLNRCAARGIRLWNVEYVEECCIRATLYEDQLEELEGLARAGMCELRVLSRRGGTKNKRFLRRRAGLLIALVLVAGLLMASSLFIWEIDVQGNETLSRGEILRALADCGLEQGSYWPGLSADMIRSRMLTELPSLAWMTVNVSGSRALVLLVERQEKPDIWKESDAADILAGKTGIVSHLTVLDGRALVQPGQAVTEGELLVTGAMTDLAGETRLVRARAEVWADTWAEKTVVVPLVTEKKLEAHRMLDHFAVKIGKKRINLFFGSGKTLDECDTIVHEYKAGLEGVFSLPLSLIREERVRWEKAAVENAALQQTKERMLAELEREISGEVLSTAFSVARENGLVYITLRAHCMENLAVVAERGAPP